jgi:hypothetical protein
VRLQSQHDRSDAHVVSKHQLPNYFDELKTLAKGPARDPHKMASLKLHVRFMCANPLSNLAYKYKLILLPRLHTGAGADAVPVPEAIRRRNLHTEQHNI